MCISAKALSPLNYKNKYMLTFHFKALRKGKNLAYEELYSRIGSRSLKAGERLKKDLKAQGYACRWLLSSSKKKRRKKSSSDPCTPLLFEYFSVAQRWASCCGVLFWIINQKELRDSIVCFHAQAKHRWMRNAAFRYDVSPSVPPVVLLWSPHGIKLPCLGPIIHKNANTSGSCPKPVWSM